MRKLEQESVRVEKTSYIYRVVHRIMEGDCQTEHGPIAKEVGPLLADKYCVTNHMFYEFIQASGYQPEDTRNYLKHWENGCYKEGEENLPVVNVSLNDAKAYAEFYGKRLPKDYEWQYLAAGEEKVHWPWGNKLDYKKCNVYGSGLEDVDARPEGVSPFGLYNMCGNVWELTDEIIADGDKDHYFTLLRGGCYYRAPHYWHAEGGAVPNDFHLKMHLLGEAMNRNETVGFRCVKDEEV